MAGDRDELLDAIEVLTKPPRVTFVQERNGIRCLLPEQDSLIEQLRDAVAGGIMSHSGGGGDDAGKWPINAGALMLNAEVQDTVGSWHVRDVHQPPAATVEDTLAAWYLAIINRRRRDGDTEALERVAVRKLVGWANRIMSMFDPVTRIELTQNVAVPLIDPVTRAPRLRRDGTPMVRYRQEPAACPRCGERVAFDRDTGDQITSLVVEYRRSAGDDALHGSTVSCRFCGTEWVGDHKVREVRWMLDHPGEFLEEHDSPSAEASP